MATHRIMIPISGIEGTGNVRWEPFSANFGSNNINDPLILNFTNTSTDDEVWGTFDVPNNYSSATTDPTIRFVWSSDQTSASGNVIWGLSYLAVTGNDTETLDPASFTQSGLTVTDAGPSAARERLEASIALTRANIAAQDTILFKAFRNGTGSDTLNGSAFLFQLIFQYDDA